MELLDNQLKEQKTLIKMLEKNRLSHAARQGVLDTLKQLTNSIDQRRSSIKALEHDMELSQRRLAKVIITCRINELVTKVLDKLTFIIYFV